jgi:pimeloyl-ACP methyl ester carboxylesterase
MSRISFNSEYGQKIFGTFERNSRNDGQIALLFHGIFVDREENGRFPRLAKRLNERNIDSIRIDLPGHGKSKVLSENATISQMAGHLSSTYRWAAAKGYTRIHVIPSSFSGALFSMIWPILETSKMGKLFFLNPVLDFHDVFIDAAKPEMKELFSESNQAKLMSAGSFNPQPTFKMTDAFWAGMLNLDIPSAYKRITGKHTLVHGNADELVDFERTKSIAIENPNCNFIELNGAVHAFTQSGHEDEVWELLLERLTA